ncbi:tetratricopeptide repeat protein [Azospirillum sp. RWY-5-1]|uniref:protein O-GlcNAc transferase n=1 Tax=Azospirillum oleiclasticum TaxID=2735135 RepID=A0ABX2TLN1_9PROT|nr:tetratricopeptide repeat protein [Azospirillum oleiclasticum]NYZ17824.1 tetratricopeptide repeat protein [Azospirillum oleiclasticum]NYZ25044.1 tetratricopeptide repeat protein [Azospirillum oleiclasticum]
MTATPAPTPIPTLGLAAHHLRENRPAETERLCRALLEAAPLGPQAASAWHLLSVVARTVGKHDAAVLCLSQAAALEPLAAHHRVGLAEALRALGRTDEAAAAFRQAAVLAPPAAAPWLLALGTVRLEQGQAAEAAAVLARAAILDPRSAEAWRRLAIAEQRAGRLEAARAAYARAYTEGGDGAMKLREALTLPVITRDRAEIADIRRRFLAIMEALERDRPPLADPLGQVGTTPFLLAYHAEDDRPLQAAMARACAAMCPSLLEVAPHCRPDAVPVPHPDGRVHVGFLSEHFFGHTIGQLNVGLIERLPRDRFHVTLLVRPARMDGHRARLLAAAERVVELPGDLAGARAAVAAERLDLLHYTDIGMTPFSYFLAFARLAPVQCLTWGHPDTTGITNLDVFLTCDAMEPEGAEAHYTERLVRLPGPTVHYRPPPPRDPEPGRAAFGLPEDATLYICPQSLFKFHPDFDPVLAAILRGDPRGLLLLVDPRAHAPALLERLGGHAPDIVDRVRVLPGQGTADFVALMGLSDVMLDPLHYSGGNTSLEALSRGTPIVTWPGAFMRGRHTHGFYRLMGMTDLVARDHGHYVELALRLGTDPGFRETMRARIRERCGVLYENDATVAAIADFLERAVGR